MKSVVIKVNISHYVNNSAEAVQCSVTQCNVLGRNLIKIKEEEN